MRNVHDGLFQTDLTVPPPPQVLTTTGVANTDYLNVLSEPITLGDLERARQMADQQSLPNPPTYVSPGMYEDFQRNLVMQSRIMSDRIELSSRIVGHATLDDILLHLLERTQRMETAFTQAVREALHHSDQGDVRQTSRILRGVLEGLGEKP